MNFYVAGKVGDGTEGVKTLLAQLRVMGHQIAFDWTEGIMVKKPYLDYPEVNAIAAEKMRQAAVDCDHFILLADDNLIGGYIEFELALASTTTKPNKKLFVVRSRQSIFYTLPQVLICADTTELLERIPQS